MKKQLPFFILALFCFFAKPFSTMAQSSACYSLTQITYAPDSLTAPVDVPWLSFPPIPDDSWSEIINIGFPFCFFGNAYSKCIVGTDGCIGFDTSHANAYNSWPIGFAMPSAMAADLKNTIMLPWEALYPPFHGSIKYQLLGVSPNRKFVVQFDSVSMYSCNNLFFTGQAELYETTNVIEIYITNKALCSTWNGGYAIEGLNNATGTDASIVPGRNFPSQWTAVNDAWQWTPLCQCPLYVPEINNSVIKIYPAPVSSALTIESNNNHLLDKIIVYSVDGRVIKSISVAHLSTVKVDLSELTSGIYFLDCVGENVKEMIKVMKY